MKENFEELFCSPVKEQCQHIIRTHNPQLTRARDKIRRTGWILHIWYYLFSFLKNMTTVFSKYGTFATDSKTSQFIPRTFEGIVPNNGIPSSLWWYLYIDNLWLYLLCLLKSIYHQYYCYNCLHVGCQQEIITVHVSLSFSQRMNNEDVLMGWKRPCFCLN